MSHREEQDRARALKKARRERQLSYEANRKKKIEVEWFPYPSHDPVEIVKFRMDLAKRGIKTFAHNEYGYALYGTEPIAN